MSGAAVTVPGSYDDHLVVLSVVISVIAAYAALGLGARVRSARGGPRLLGLSGGAVAMGVGIWSMHYIGMLAFYLPVPVMYDWPTVLLSLLAAIAGSGVALSVVSRPRLGLSRAVVASIFMGGGIAAEHYIGMSAMRLPATSHYSSSVVALSVALAIGISFVSLWVTLHADGNLSVPGWKTSVGSLAMGATAPVVHYTGMAAASFSPAALVEHDLFHAVGVSALGITGIVSATLMVLGLILLTSMADRQVSQEVTDRRQAETALIDSERAYGVTFDAAPFGIAHESLDGRCLRINQRCCDLLGYTADEIKATDFTALTHPDDVEKSVEARRQLRAGLIDRQALLKR